MSLTPVFELDFLNAWLLIVPFLILNYGISFVLVKRQSLLFAAPEYTARERQGMLAATGLLMINAAYSFFVPLEVGTVWVVLGLIVYGVGMAFVADGIYVFSRMPDDQYNTRGLYRVSRNPKYFGILLVFVGAGLAGASWLMIVIAVVVWGLHDRFGVPPEERMCLAQFGDSYRDYLAHTPRWIGLPRS